MQIYVILYLKIAQWKAQFSRMQKLIIVFLKTTLLMELLLTKTVLKKFPQNNPKFRVLQLNLHPTLQRF